jgi:hypothetical protein
MSLIAGPVEPSTVTNDYSETVDGFIANHLHKNAEGESAPLYSGLVPIAEKDFPKTLRNLRTAALAKGYGVKVISKTVENGMVTAVVGLGSPQKRERAADKPTAADKPKPTADKAPEKATAA